MYPTQRRTLEEEGKKKGKKKKEKNNGSLFPCPERPHLQQICMLYTNKENKGIYPIENKTLRTRICIPKMS